MLRYVAGRLLQSIPLLCLLSVVAFSLLAAAPGDPAQALLQRRSGGVPPRASDVVRVRHNLGLDRPLPERYLRWVGDALHGDFGVSYVTGRPVKAILRDVVPPTLLLTGTALLLTTAGGLTLGLAAGLSPGSWISRSVGGLAVILFSTPTFLIGLLAVLVFSVQWQLFPSSGMTRAGEAVTISGVGWHLALPAIVLAFGHHLAAYTRLVEAGVVETRSADFVENARARGLPSRVVALRHVLRGSLVPFVAQVGASLGGLVGGAYAVEVIFSWPGMGRTALQAASGRDYALLMAIVLITGVMVVLGNLLADLVVAALDPRVRLQPLRSVRQRGGLRPLTSGG